MVNTPMIRAILRNILVVAWVTGLCALGTRALLAKDARYGFGMFAHKVRYEVHYVWVYEGGREDPYVPGEELKGRTAQRLAPGKSLYSHYATGAMKAWVGGYAHYMWEHRAPADARAFRAVVRHKIVGRPGSHTWVVTVPPAGESAP